MIADPRLSNPVARILAACDIADAYNYPVTSHDSVGSAGKPGSRPPGSQQAPWLVAELERILTRAAERAEAAIAAAKVRDSGDGSELPTSVGVVAIEVPASPMVEASERVSEQWEDAPSLKAIEKRVLDVAKGKLVARKRGPYLGPLVKKAAEVAPSKPAS